MTNLKVLNKSMKTVFYERKIASKEKEKANLERKLSSVRTRTLMIGREKKIEKISEKMEKLDDDITTMKISIAESIDKQLMKRAQYALKRWTGAEFETEKEKLGVKFSTKEKSAQKKADKVSKEKTDALDQLIKSGALDNKDQITDATLKELKKILKVDEGIREELKEIKETMIDEQDTKIKEKKKAPKVTKAEDIPATGMRTAKAESSLLSTLVAAGLSAAMLAKIFNDYMKEHGDELVPQWLPDWVKDLKLEDAPDVATAGAKTAATALKGVSAAKRGIGAGAKALANKASTKMGSNGATKKILKAEAKNASKASAKVGGIIYKRIAGETTEAMTKRIAGDMMERAATKAAGKKIPVAGVSIAFGLAYMRWAQGDVGGAIGEVVSGVASIFPGVGTAVSFATDAVLIWRDVANIVEKIEAREAEEKMARAKRSEGIQKLVVQKQEQARLKRLNTSVDESLSGDKKYQTLKKEKDALFAKQKSMVDAGEYNTDEFKELNKRIAEVNTEVNNIRQGVIKKLESTDMFAKERKALQDASKTFADYVKKNGNDNSDEFTRLQANMLQKSTALQTAIHAGEDEASKRYLAEATAEYDKAHPETSPATIGRSSMNQVMGKGLKQTGQSSEAMKFFMSKGWTKEQAAGIVGNLMVESNLKTDALGDSGKAYGIAQWHPDRQAVFSRVYGKDIRQSTFNEQMEFVHYELTQGNEKGAGSKVKSTQSAQEAAAVVDKYYERSSGEHRNRRIATATNLMKSTSDGTMMADAVTSPAVVNKDSSSNTEAIASNDVTPAVVSKDKSEIQAMQVSQNLTKQTVTYDTKSNTHSGQMAMSNAASNIQSTVINRIDEGTSRLLDAFNDTPKYS